ncbi:MAG: hydantoinase B/oxoprolinase family protein [Candidatus Helarchaeota archaeon]|nr:hydantoinase B/oxoprolinase family protein [Candidatus Helarchaeota archaeon]
MLIGWKGKKLIEMLNESENLLKETGKYYGLEKLKRKEEDPLRYERVFAKIRGTLVSARETALHIAASPIVRFLGELCFAVYTPEGDSIALSTGIIVHVHTMSEAIKWMIRENYENEVRFKEGDIFCNNDPAMGNVHTADVQAIVPLFFKDELIGWAAGVTHQIDIGAAAPGHDPATARSRFEEGIHISCEKIGENDKVFKWYKMRCKYAVRTPFYWDFDEKARIAGCHMIRNSIYKIIEEEGIDYYKDFIREIIEEGRRIFRARVRERIFPGRYRTASFSLDIPCREKVIDGKYKLVLDEVGTIRGMHAPIEIEIGRDGEFKISFEGANSAGKHAFNCTPTSMQGGLWVLLTQALCYDGKVNDGAYLAVDAYFPERSWSNPKDFKLSYAVAWAFLMPAFTGLFRLLSRGFFSKGYREEVISGYGMTADAIQGGGITKLGDYFPIANLEISSVGLGASAIRDGLDFGYAMWNPESDMGDAEVWESLERGLPYLGRRVKPDTAGFGKFRGGSGWETLRMVYGVKRVTLGVGREGTTFVGSGIFGGYPHATGYRLYARDTNMKELIKLKKKYPIGETDPIDSEVEKSIQGEIVKSEFGHLVPSKDFNNYDLIHCILSGAPGYGDPLERSLRNVKKDIDDGIYTKKTLEKVFGVITKFDADKNESIIDKQKTEMQRAKMREKRKEKAISYERFYDLERENILKKNLNERILDFYRDSLTISKKFREEFHKFWNLPEDFLL